MKIWLPLLAILLLLPVTRTVATTSLDSIAGDYRTRLKDAYNNQQITEFNNLIQPALDYFAKHNNWDAYFDARMLRCDMSIYGNRSEEALTEAKDMYRLATEKSSDYGKATALAVMAEVYSGVDNWSSATEVALEGIQIMSGHNRLEDLHLLYNLYMIYAQISLDLLYDAPAEEMLEKMERILAEFESVISRIAQHPNNESERMDTLRFNIYSLYSMLYINTGQLKRAEEYITLMEPLAKSIVSKRSVYRRKIWLYEDRENFDQALAVIDTLEQDYLATGGHEQSIIYLLDDKINICRKAGYYLMALDAYKQRSLLTDSVQRVEMNAQLDEMRIRYEVERHITEKVYHRNYFLLASFICLLLIVVLVLWIIYSYKLKRKNLSLIERIRLQDELQTQLETHASQQKESEPTAEVDSLFESITRLVEDERAYIDPRLNRTSLAALVNSNETYVRQSIQKNTGLTVNDYLKKLRLRHARELLANNQHTVEAVALDSGFGSRNTFHKVFREEYGLTPDEFRRFSS